MSDHSAIRPRLSEMIPLLIDVQEKLDQEIDLKSLAREHGTSPFHFHRLFSNAVGETPKQHVERLRLERASYLVAVTEESLLNICLSVGFKNHETFSRAFKKFFGMTRTAYRQMAKALQAERLERNKTFRGEGCTLSDVRFVTLPPMALLALRHVGDYNALGGTPFTAEDAHWNTLIAFTAARNMAATQLAISIPYDDPTLTPPHLQRLDICVPLATEFEDEGRMRCLAFAGGTFAMCEHSGPYDTTLQGYRHVADGIRRSVRYAFSEGAPLQIFRVIDPGGDPFRHRTEIYFPVAAKSQRQRG